MVRILLLVIAAIAVVGCVPATAQPEGPVTWKQLKDYLDQRDQERQFKAQQRASLDALTESGRELDRLALDSNQVAIDAEQLLQKSKATLQQAEQQRLESRRASENVWWYGLPIIVVVSGMFLYVTQRKHNRDMAELEQMKRDAADRQARFAESYAQLQQSVADLEARMAERRAEGQTSA